MQKLVRSQLAINYDAWAVFENWQKPFLTKFSDSDTLTNGGEQRFQQEIPGAANQSQATIQSAGHFLQEDKGEELASYLIDWFR
jgi:haloalkane dehalogenase